MLSSNQLAGADRGFRGGSKKELRSGSLKGDVRRRSPATQLAAVILPIVDDALE